MPICGKIVFLFSLYIYFMTQDFVPFFIVTSNTVTVKGSESNYDFFISTLIVIKSDP